MAAAVGRLALWLTCRVPVDRDIARRVTAPYLCWRRHRERRPAVTTRQYSSDSKDDLTVRYLDGEDAESSHSFPLYWVVSLSDELPPPSYFPMSKGIAQSSSPSNGSGLP
ncbi:hypothetical protein ATANTOWER_023650 [Ataeniobius toweri]|uniref:Uncharacterized protein n=1 Tax=Ataeniobius toweri TaxID=208326 RepID=A0ABU7AZA2_9TELE|nr:hypothetical protein [Ataeniobius toweri]